MKKILIATVVIVLLNSVTINNFNNRGSPSHIEQSQVHSQEQVGLLAAFLQAAWPYFNYLVLAIGIGQAFSWAWDQISSLFSGRPDFGPGSATGCDADFFSYSKNGFVRNLGSTFVVLQHLGASLSNGYWPLFTEKAQDFCTDMENRCGYVTGKTACQQYLYLAANTSNACSTWSTILREQYLDNTYKQCW